MAGEPMGDFAKCLCLQQQQGYGAFSVSSSNISSVIKYIANQEAHHRKISFEDEFISLLKKHKMPFDPEYVFG
jgi:hypothetical protein